MINRIKEWEFDPRTKLFLLLAIGSLAIAIPAPDKLVGLTVISLIIPALSRISLWGIMEKIWSLALLLVGFSMIGAFLDPRLPWLVTLGSLHISKPGMFTALFTSWRVIIVLWWAFWFTTSTSVRAMSMALEWLLSPLRRVGLNTSALVLATVIALRFIPELLEEGRLIREAQYLRGYRSQSNQPQQAARGLLVIMVPLLIRTWLRAEELADAVLARGYRKGDTPTRLHTLKITILDMGLLIGIGIFSYWALL